MDIKQIALDTIIALGLVPEEKVIIDKIDLDWDEEPELRVTSEPTKPEDVTQAGTICSETLMCIHALARGERQVAWDLMRHAALAVYTKFEEMEQTPKSGILAITLVEHNTVQLPNNLAFHSFIIFRVLHKPTF